MLTGPLAGLTRDAISIDGIAHNRLFRLVDTAGLTRILQDKRLMAEDVDRKINRLSSKAGISTALRRLPGIYHQPHSTRLSRADDPSQFSLHVSEMALKSALEAMRYITV